MVLVFVGMSLYVLLLCFMYDFCLVFECVGSVSICFVFMNSGSICWYVSTCFVVCVMYGFSVFRFRGFAVSRFLDFLVFSCFVYW